MIDSILQALQGLPHEIVIAVIAAMPVVEVRLSIPVAIELFDMSVWQAVILSFLGASIPAVLIPIALDPVEKFCRNTFPWCDNFFEWIVARVHGRYTEKYQALGAIGLALFIAIPLPVTGVWTGALAAWVFRIKKTTAILAILLGLVMACVVVTLITIGTFGAFRIAI